MNDEELKVSTGDAPEVVVEVHGDLRVTGSEGHEVTAESMDEGTLEVEERDGAVHVRCRSDADISVPSGSRLTIEVAHGDVEVGSVTGSVVVRHVAGDLRLRDVGTVEVGDVSGDLSARRVGGDLTVNRVAADASARAVGGSFSAESIGSDLFLRGVAGDVSAMVGADAALSLEPSPGRRYQVTAGGGVACRVPEEADAVVRIMSGSGSVVLRLPGVDLPEPVDGAYTLTLGAGGPEIALQAGGGVVLSSSAELEPGMAEMGIQFAEDFGGMAEEIAGQVEVKVDRMMANLSEHLSRLSETLPGVLEASGLSGAEADRIADRVRESGERAAERAARRAERKARTAARRAERKAEKAARIAERRERRKGFFAFGPPGPPGVPTGFRWTSGGRPPRREPVSDEERRTVLRMLEEGRITAEEAESLLKALGGRG